MKKISLKNLKIEVDDMLEREQLKSILGGQLDYGNGTTGGTECGGCGCFDGCASPSGGPCKDFNGKSGFCAAFYCSPNGPQGFAVGAYCKTY